MSAGLGIDGQVLWGTNGAVKAYVDALCRVVAREYGPTDALAAFLLEEARTFFPGKVVFLDEQLADDDARRRLAALLVPTKDEVLGDGELSDLGVEWVSTVTRDLEGKLALSIQTRHD